MLTSISNKEKNSFIFSNILKVARVVKGPQPSPGDLHFKGHYGVMSISKDFSQVKDLVVPLGEKREESVCELLKYAIDLGAWRLMTDADYNCISEIKKAGFNVSGTHQITVYGKKHMLISMLTIVDSDYDWNFFHSGMNHRKHIEILKKKYDRNKLKTLIK